MPSFRKDENTSKLVADLQLARSRASSFKWNNAQHLLSEWRAELRKTLEAVDAEHSRSLDSLIFAPQVISPLVSEADWKIAFQNGLNSAIRLIEQAILEVNNRQELGSLSEGPLQTDDSGKLHKKRQQIFVVHGHDHGCRDAVSLFVERMGFEAVVLDERANKGAAIIERLEEFDSTNVVYAIVLMTPDDVGGENENCLKPRARQNVIFEAGYFIGRLKRRKVCAIMKESLELPSDMSGIMYIPFDEGGGWKFRLVRELKSLELEVDANLAL